MTLREIARLAAFDAHAREKSLLEQADAVAIAVLREVEKNCSAQLLTQWLAEFDAPGTQERTTEKNDHGAGLIHQVASPLADTEPRLNTEAEMLATLREIHMECLDEGHNDSGVMGDGCDQRGMVIRCGICVALERVRLTIAKHGEPI